MKLTKLRLAVMGIFAVLWLACPPPTEDGQQMAFWPIVAALAASAIGGALGGRKANRTATQSGSNAYNNTATTSFQESPEQSQLFQSLAALAQRRLANPTPIAGYQATGIGNINDVFSRAAAGRENALTARGLAGSPIAGNADILSSIGRAGEIAKFQNTLPMVQRDWEAQDAGLAGSVYGLRPQGQTTTTSGTGSYQGQQVAPGSPLTGGVNSFANMLAFLIGSGAIKGLGGRGANPDNGGYG